MRKAERDPLVPVGCGATLACLLAGLYTFHTGQAALSQKMMRARVVAQGATIVVWPSAPSACRWRRTPRIKGGPGAHPIEYAHQKRKQGPATRIGGRITFLFKHRARASCPKLWEAAAPPPPPPRLGRRGPSPVVWPCPRRSGGCPRRPLRDLDLDAEKIDDVALVVPQRGDEEVVPERRTVDLVVQQHDLHVPSRLDRVPDFGYCSRVRSGPCKNLQFLPKPARACSP